DDIFLLYLGDEDIKALNNSQWPISRDYYSYVVHLLNKAGAKAIGIDLLFSGPDQSHPEYDQTLADFFKAAGNVCLPMKFSELANGQDDKNSLMTGINPTYPLQLLEESIQGVGFSNFGKTARINKVPIIVNYKNAIITSFGFELMRLYLGGKYPVELNDNNVVVTDSSGQDYFIAVDKSGSIRINHFGDTDHMNSIGFVDFLQLMQSKPDSLDLKNKLVVIAVTAPGISPLKATPYSNALPASLIHATVAENLITQNYLIDVPFYVQWFVIVLLIFLAYLLWGIEKRNVFLTSILIVPLFFWTISQSVFSGLNYILPIFYPSLAYFATILYFTIADLHHRQERDSSVTIMLNDQVALKENQLAEMKEMLNKKETEVEKEIDISQQSRQLAEERKRTIITLEKEIDDLKSYAIPEKKESKIFTSNVIHAPDSKMTKIINMVTKISSDDIPILIFGETGTGKEMIAHLIHESSPRKENPFVAVNCGALSETLLDSELFGHEKGSFTGAHSQRRGRFELADGGTIFLDEITETTPTFQAKLLRVLQEKTFERLGGEKTINVDVRIVAATNKNIQKEMENQSFRSDLYYRLNGINLTLPLLRERHDDIPLLANHFLNKHHYPDTTSFSDRVIDILKSYHWPGNVRELENIVRRAVVLAQSEGRSLIQEKDLPAEMVKERLSINTGNIHKPLEQQILESLRALKFSHSSISQTAKALGDKDRGTITEYLRGICFQYLTDVNFDINQAAKNIADTSDDSVIIKVKTKIEDYLENLKTLIADPNYEKNTFDKSSAAYKGLPKRYHPYLNQILEYLEKSSN
ncbi:sigma 54-interacting transcriptional regulator, partial [Calditrichota bacterium]